ncbi:MAG TPA: TolC family protein, partial [bacterium]|nr:TolC family protein [bacterium]
EHLARLDTLEPVVRNEYVTGRTGQNALLQLQMARERLMNRIDQLERRSVPVMDRIQAALNLPPGAPLSLHLVPADFIEFSDDDARTWLRESHPDLKSLESLAAAAENGVSLAERDRYPGLTLGMNYMVTGDARMAGVEDSGKDPFNVSLSLNIPVSRRYGAAERRARLQEAAARDRLHAAGNRLDTMLSDALFAYRDALSTVRLHTESLIPLAEQTLEAALQDFQAGDDRFSQVIDAQRELLDLMLAKESARFDAARSLARIESLTGRSLLGTSKDIL